MSLELEGAASFAVCSGFFLDSGNKVNKLVDTKNNMKLLLVNVFPQDNRTIALFSWLNEDADTYSEFQMQYIINDI